MHYKYLTNPYKYGGIDLLRALAIILVVIYHSATVSPENVILYNFVHFMWIGVDLFFVISGFLIGGMLYKNLKLERFSLKTFYIDRFYRIMPIYIFIVILTVLARGYYSEEGIQINETIKYFFVNVLFFDTYSEFFFPEYFSKTQLYAVVGGWSLAIEQFFYIIIPIVLIVSYKYLNFAKTIQLLILISLFSLLYKLYFIHNFVEIGDYNWIFFHYMRPPFRMDQLLYGVILALLISHDNIERFLFKYKYFMLFIAFFILLFILTYINFYNYNLFKSRQFILSEAIWLPTLLAIMFTIIMLVLYKIKIENKFIIFIARISYPLYLVHLFVQRCLPVGFYQYIIYTCIITYLVSLLIEYPMLKKYKKI